MTTENTLTTSYGSFFGKPKYGSSFISWKNFYLEDGDNVFRLAPAVKSLAQKGIWAKYYKVHWGYSVADPENPDRSFSRPFECTYEENWRTKMVEQECAECDLTQSKRDEMERDKEAARKAGKSEEDAEASTGATLTWLKQHSLDKKWYVLAKNTDGKWGVLYLPHKAKQDLDAVINDLQKENGIDPLDPEHGVWFNFTRSGKGINTTYKVKVIKQRENIQGRSYETIKEAPLTVEDIKAIDTELPDLATVNDNKRITSEQVEQIVKSSGDPAVIASIFNSTFKSPTTSEASKTETVVKAVPEIPATQPIKTQAPESDDLIAKLQKQLADALAAKAVATAPVTPGATAVVAVSGTPAAVATPSDIPSFADALKMDTKDFLKLFPDPNRKP